MTVRIINADVMDGLAQLESDSVHCVVTSPPYWGLRCYGTDGQIGLEPTLAEHINRLVAVFAEVRRVLRPDGVCFVNYGDAYASHDPGGYREGEFLNPGGRQPNKKGRARNRAGVYRSGNLKAKDLCLIPERLAIALQDAGWWIRDRIVWAKPNPMPSSVTDRCTPSYELIYMLTKRARYWWDQEAVREPHARLWNPETNGGSWAHPERQPKGSNAGHHSGPYPAPNPAGRNLRNVWTFATAPFADAHFATFPPKLVERCLSAACPERVCADCGAPWVREVERTSANPTAGRNGWKATGQTHRNDIDRAGGFYDQSTKTVGFSPSCDCQAETAAGTVLDPFFGSGTTGLVADRMRRNAIGIELSADYCEMARKRIEGDSPLFAAVQLGGTQA